MSERKEGWYWVKTDGAWGCVEWVGDRWEIVGCSRLLLSALRRVHMKSSKP